MLPLTYEHLLEQVEAATEEYEAVMKFSAENSMNESNVASESIKQLNALGKELEETSKLVLNLEPSVEQQKRIDPDCLVQDDESLFKAYARMEKQELEISTLNDEIRSLQKELSATEKKLSEVALGQASLPAEEADPIGEESRDLLSWNKQMLVCLKNFTGISVEDVTSTSFVVCTDNMRLRVGLDSTKESEAMTSVSLVDNANESNRFAPVNQKCITPIVEEALAKNDLPFLLQEIDSFVLNRAALNAELEELAKYFPLSMVKREVVVTLSEGIVLTIAITSSYPGLNAMKQRTGCHAELIAVDSLNGTRQSLSDAVKAKYHETKGIREPTITAMVKDIVELMETKHQRRNGI